MMQYLWLKSMLILCVAIPFPEPNLFNNPMDIVHLTNNLTSILHALQATLIDFNHLVLRQ